MKEDFETEGFEKNLSASTGSSAYFSIEKSDKKTQCNPLPKYTMKQGSPTKKNLETLEYITYGSKTDLVPQSLSNQGILLIEDRRYEDAMRCFQKLVEAKQGNKEGNKAWFNFSSCKIANSQNAIEFLDKIEELGTKEPRFFYIKGLELYELHKIDEAIEYFDKAEELGLNSFEFYVTKGDLFYESFLMKQWEKCSNKVFIIEKAIEYYNKALHSDSDNPFILFNKACSLLLLDKKEEAIQCFDSTKCLIDYNYYHKKGVFYWIIGRAEEAIEYFDTALKSKDCDIVDLLSCKAASLYDLKRYNESLKCFNSAETLASYDIKDPYFYFYKGKLLYDLDKANDAIECYDQALELDPNNTDILFHKGKALYGLCKHEEALELFNIAEKLGLNSPEFYELKGYLLKYLSKPDIAIEYYNNALKLDDKNSNILEKKLSTQVCIETAQEPLEILGYEIILFTETPQGSLEVQGYEIIDDYFTKDHIREQSFEVVCSGITFTKECIRET